MADRLRGGQREERYREIPMRLLFLFAKRFIAGESLEEAIHVIRRKKDSGFLTTVDILGESVSEIGASKEAADEYVELLARLKNEGLELNISLKPTMLGLAISKELCYENVRKVLEKAREVGAYIRIDMEGSDYTDATLELVRRWHEDYFRIGAVIQAMLKRSPADVENLLKAGIGIRLCKGAYKEPHTIAFKDKRDVDSQYVKIAERLLESGIYHGIATHDEKIISHVKNYVERRGISRGAFEFQMLYGIRPVLQQRLIDDGWHLRVYIPYGQRWLRYTCRRLRERKENLFFIAKNLFRK